jgi:hypothetical protein
LAKNIGFFFPTPKLTTTNLKITQKIYFLEIMGSNLANLLILLAEEIKIKAPPLLHPKSSSHG